MESLTEKAGEAAPMLGVYVRGDGTPAGRDGVRELERVRGGGEVRVWGSGVGVPAAGVVDVKEEAVASCACSGGCDMLSEVAVRMCLVISAAPSQQWCGTTQQHSDLAVVSPYYAATSSL